LRQGKKRIQYEYDEYSVTSFAEAIHSWKVLIRKVVYRKRLNNGRSPKRLS